MKNISTKKKTFGVLQRLQLLLLLMLSGLSVYSQVVSIDVAPKVICFGQQATFTASVIGAPSGTFPTEYVFRFGNGDSAVLNQGTPVKDYYNYQYPAPGIYKVELVVKFNNKPNVLYSYWDTVYNLPTASFVMTSKDSQCFKDNYYTWINKSKPGAYPSTPFTKFEWVFGDGNNLTITDPKDTINSHVYPLGNRRFSVSLKITDAAGCFSSTAGYVFVAPDINPRFSLTGTPRCDTTPYIFINQSPLGISNVAWFKWYFGDDSVYTSSVPPVPADAAMWGTFTYKYIKEGVFTPSLVVKHKLFNCVDSFNYLLTGDQLPENIIVKIDIRTRRTGSNDSLADTVCYANRNQASVCLYNNYSLVGPGGTPVAILWDFADPYANPPGSDKFLNQLSVCYKYNELGMYFPTLRIACPGIPQKIQQYNYYSRIDTIFDSSYVYLRFPLAPHFPVASTSYQFAPARAQPYPPQNPAPPPGRANLAPPLAPNTFIGYKGWKIGDSINMAGLFYADTRYGYQITDSLLYSFFSRKPADTAKFVKFNDLYGYGVSIIGPRVRIENADPLPVVPNGPEPGSTIPQYQKNQCGPSYPIEFSNGSEAYQSNDLYTLWDFGDDFAPACTSYSEPNFAAPNNGKAPYVNASDMTNRTDGRFIANGRAYAGRVLECRYSHDTLPIHAYKHWDQIFNWYMNGHDFPPYDSSTTTGWTKNPGLVTWNGTNGVKLVWSGDTGTWGYPYMAGGTVPTRMDTMANMWPADMNPGREITTNAPIPDPFAQAKGYWQLTISAGYKITPTGYIDPNNLGTMPDGTLRRYRGNDIVPGMYPPTTFYRYVFDRVVTKCITVTLKMTDSSNNQSRDRNSNFRRVDLVGDSLVLFDINHKTGQPYNFYKYKIGQEIINNKFKFRGDWITVKTDAINPSIKYVMIHDDPLVVDALDCGGTSTVQLPLMKPDAYGLGKAGLMCPGFKANGGGDPTIVYDNSAGTPGLAPTCAQRTFMLFNFDSLLDRKDNTPCALDAFVGFDGVSPMTGTATTPGGLNIPPHFNGPNWNPLLIWPSVNGARNVAQYVPNQPGLPYANMPKDPKGFVTVGLIIGNGCLSPTNCAQPGCVTDTVWYHNFFHFIELNANFTFWRYDTNSVSVPPFCYLRGKGDVITFSYYDTLQTFVKSDAWDWGDGIVTVDSFYTNNFDTLVVIPRTGTPGVYDTVFFAQNTYPIARHRYTFDAEFNPWKVLSKEVANVGTRVVNIQKIDTIWRCDDPLRAGPPQRIDTSYIRFDSAFMLLPINHKYTKSSWEMNIPSGGGLSVKRNDITPVTHIMITTTGCLNVAVKYLVIGVVDTFDINDTTFCVGETAYFTDSVRYWLPWGCFRPEPPGTEKGEWRAFNVDRWEIAYRNYPNDSIKTYVNPTNFNKIDTFYFERMYWDFESDGVIDFSGKNPSHKFDKAGRYKVAMITRDSAGYWDTCIRYVNVVQPIANFTSKGLFDCKDTVQFKDSSVVLDACYLNFGFSCDNIVSRKWWFGDFGYGEEDYRSVILNPVYDYRKNGKYYVQLAIKTEQGCVDTIKKKIFIQGPRPYIKLIADSIGCAPYTVRVVSIPDYIDSDEDASEPTKLTIIQSGRPDKYQVLSTARIDTIYFTYDQPGVYYITAQGFDNANPGLANCPTVTIPDTVGGLEAPIRIRVNKFYKVDIASSKDTVCLGEVFKIFNRSAIDTITNFIMVRYDSAYKNIFDTVFKTNIIRDTSFQYILNQVGTYHMVMKSTKYVMDAPACASRDTVTVRAVKTTALFDIKELGLPLYGFNNVTDTTSADHYKWVIYNPDGSIRWQRDVPNNYDEFFNIKEHNFGNDTGEFTVCLWAYTPAPTTCVDSICKSFSNWFEIGIKIPNVFTPNGDGINDVFKIEIKGEEFFDIRIWNRWGNLVFNSEKADKQWNGKVQNTGEDAPEGTYFFIIKYRLRTETEKELKGSITLIRK